MVQTGSNHDLSCWTLNQTWGLVHPFLRTLNWTSGSVLGGSGSNRSSELNLSITSCKYTVSTIIHIFCYGTPSPVSPTVKPSPNPVVKYLKSSPRSWCIWHNLSMMTIISINGNTVFGNWFQGLTVWLSIPMHNWSHSGDNTTNSIVGVYDYFSSHFPMDLKKIDTSGLKLKFGLSNLPTESYPARGDVRLVSFWRSLHLLPTMKLLRNMTFNDNLHSLYE